MSTTPVTENVPGADLMRSLILPARGAEHATDPTAPLSTMDRAVLHDVIQHGAAEYIKAMEACNALRAANRALHDAGAALAEQVQCESARADAMAARASYWESVARDLLRAPMTMAGDTGVPVARVVPPGGWCLGEQEAGRCRCGDCKVVHGDQRLGYGDGDVAVEGTDGGEERAAAENGGMEM
jgi:hypothetical protein